MMKCYYCGKADCTEHPLPDCEAVPITEKELDMAELEATAKKANEEALEALGRVKELEESLADADELNAVLRAELRRYEPSDGVMYRLHDYHQHVQGAATLLHGWLAARANTGVPPALESQTHDWLRTQSQLCMRSPIYPLPSTHGIILALHTVIDEARRLFDDISEKRVYASAAEALRDSDAWVAKVDAWRQKVLVHEAREKLAEPYATLNQRLKEALEANVRLSIEYALASGKIVVDSQRDSG